MSSGIIHDRHSAGDYGTTEPTMHLRWNAGKLQQCNFVLVYRQGVCVEARSDWVDVPTVDGEEQKR